MLLDKRKIGRADKGFCSFFLKICLTLLEENYFENILDGIRPYLDNQYITESHGSVRTNVRGKRMAPEYFIAKVYRQHTSLVIAVPRAVCIALGLKAGQHMVFTWQQKEGKFKFGKFIPEGAQDDRVGTDTNRQHQGG